MENTFENALDYVHNLGQIDYRWSESERILASAFMSYAAKTVKNLTIPVVSNWVATKERLPKITIRTASDWVLTFDPTACRIDKAFFSEVTGWQAEHGEQMNVTHWQPLPKPPCC